MSEQAISCCRYKKFSKFYFIISSKIRVCTLRYIIYDIYQLLRVAAMRCPPQGVIPSITHVHKLAWQSRFCFSLWVWLKSWNAKIQKTNTINYSVMLLNITIRNINKPHLSVLSLFTVCAACTQSSLSIPHDLERSLMWIYKPCFRWLNIYIYIYIYVCVCVCVCEYYLQKMFFFVWCVYIIVNILIFNAIIL